MDCKDEKNIDQTLQHLRECDECFIKFKIKIADFLSSKSGKVILKMLSKMGFEKI